jgi:hypothetical protein
LFLLFRLYCPFWPLRLVARVEIWYTAHYNHYYLFLCPKRAENMLAARRLRKDSRGL